MKEFTHVNATSVADAEAALAQYGSRAKIIAGGTDLIGLLKLRALRTQPECLINLKTIQDLDYIDEDSSGLKLGALTRLHDIAVSPVVTAKYPALAAAARAVASWQIRSMGTIGGNICQETRCWYYRSSWNKFDCLRKGGSTCYAVTGNNHEHSIFGHASNCFAAHPSDTAPALVALDASIKTNKRTVAATSFFDGFKGTTLAADEFVVSIQVPTPAAGSKQGFAKASVRRAIDFAIVNAACLITPASGNITSARVVVSAASPVPLRVAKVEDALVGKTLSEATVVAAAEEVVNMPTFLPLPLNGHKVQVAKGVIKRALLA
ncbi:MAG: FAD binding domain-containing protein [Dehalococcoidia bacterium]|nr:FAD binding domain-containing protein [Dehalococcoidia bacterium]